MGEGADRELISAALSSAKWATKCPGLANMSIPMTAIVVPAASILVRGLTGGRFTSTLIGDTFVKAYSEGMEESSEALRALPGEVDDALQEISGAFGDITDAMSQAFVDMVDAMTSAVNDFGESLGGLFD